MPPPLPSRYSLSDPVSLVPTFAAMFDTMGVVPTVPSGLSLSSPEESLLSALAEESIDAMSTLCSEIWTG